MIPVNDSIPIEMLGQSTDPSHQDYLDIMLTYCGEKKNVFSKCFIDIDSRLFSGLIVAAYC